MEWGGINLYAFVKNSPLGNTDPFGRATITIPPAIPAIIAGGVGIGLGCLINRAACNSTRDLVIGLAEAQADANAPDGSTHRGPGAVDGNDADLLTHCIATCDLVRHPGQCGGPDGALAAMQRREDRATPGSQIDYLNNAVGSGVGVSPDNAGQDCTTACLDALNRGLLFTIVNGQPAPRPRT